MKLLLDTHAFIWWASEPQKLSQRALELIENTENELILSVASVWEIQIKIQLSKLDLDMPIKELIESQKRSNALHILPVELRHVFELNNLPKVAKASLPPIAGEGQDGGLIKESNQRPGNNLLHRLNLP